MPRAYFYLPGCDFLSVLQGAVAVRGLPEETRFVSASYEPLRGGWMCIVEHESFPETAVGAEFPHVPIEMVVPANVCTIESVGMLAGANCAADEITEMERRLSAIAGAKDWSDLERAVGGTAELTTIVANAEAHKGITSAEMAMRARRLIERCADVKPGQIVVGGIAMGGVCRSSPDSFVFTERKPTLAEFGVATDNLTCGESLGEPVNRKTWRDREPLL